jgi:uncharacterized repeat protein (TIGR03843 family)
VTPDLLEHGVLTVEGRVVTASNLTLYARVDGADGTSTSCVYKPVSGERPLWDFPDGTLAARERAAYLVSEAGGWHLVPHTVLRDGPLGPGMCQEWVVTDESRPWVDVLDAHEALADGWIEVLRGQDETGRPVALVHRDDAALRSMAVMDTVLNNADRKGGHLLRATDGRLRGVDHGLCLHTDPKLRTVLWGYAGRALTPSDVANLTMLDAWLGTEGRAALRTLLSPLEVAALTERVDVLGTRGVLPRPSRATPAIPWPAF